jgi:hypothetical protein
MKRFFGFAMIVALLSVPAFAAKNSQTVKLATIVTVGSTQIPAGDCKVTWTVSGSSAQVTLAENGKILVTVPAKVVDQRNDSISVATNSTNGSNVLMTINLDKVSLVLGSGPVSGQ